MHLKPTVYDHLRMEDVASSHTSGDWGKHWFGLLILISIIPGLLYLHILKQEPWQDVPVLKCIVAYPSLPLCYHNMIKSLNNHIPSCKYRINLKLHPWKWNQDMIILFRTIYVDVCIAHRMHYVRRVGPWWKFNNKSSASIAQIITQIPTQYWFIIEFFGRALSKWRILLTKLHKHLWIYCNQCFYSSSPPS